LLFVPEVVRIQITAPKLTDLCQNADMDFVGTVADGIANKLEPRP